MALSCLAVNWSEVLPAVVSCSTGLRKSSSVANWRVLRVVPMGACTRASLVAMRELSVQLSVRASAEVLSLLSTASPEPMSTMPDAPEVVMVSPSLSQAARVRMASSGRRMYLVVFIVLVCLVGGAGLTSLVSSAGLPGSTGSASSSRSSGWGWPRVLPMGWGSGCSGHRRHVRRPRRLSTARVGRRR